MGKRIISRRRGHGGSVYLSPSHRHKGTVTIPRGEHRGVVEDIIHDPGHSAPVAVIRYDDGTVGHMIACDGLRVNQTIYIGAKQKNAPGNAASLGTIPEGTVIYNIEGHPGDGGRYVRAGGAAATVISHGKETVVQMPSGSFKTFHNDCRAQIGSVAGGGRKDKPLLKAGTNYYRNRAHSRVWPIVRGVAMNAVNHPHGSGRKQRVGGPTTVSRHSPPGQKVGRFSPKRKTKK